MKLLTAQQIRDWDQFTIRHEPITSIDLMERAANACVAELVRMIEQQPVERIVVCCGPGNNGGDGFAIARLLKQLGYPVVVVELESQTTSPDQQINKQRFLALAPDARSTAAGATFGKHDLIVDALFGTGLNRGLDGQAAQLVQQMNQSGCPVVAIDLPSGLPADPPEKPEQFQSIVKATRTLVFQTPRLSMLFPETGGYAGAFTVLDIGLSRAFELPAKAPVYITASAARQLIRPRPAFGHKGNFGHLLTVGGSFGKMGAAILMSRSALRTGCGLVTAFIPKVGYTILQTAFPEGMTETDDGFTELSEFPKRVEAYQAFCVGPGMGTSEVTRRGLAGFLPLLNKPTVLDADALNILSLSIANGQGTLSFPEACIITPHPKEFDRLAGKSDSAYARFQRQIAFAKKYRITVVLKGAHTSIVNPEGDVFFNGSGNVALATGGSGDVLSGIIASLLAQGYDTTNAAVLGVFLHGYCADQLVARRRTLLASDLVEYLPEGFAKLAG